MSALDPKDFLPPSDNRELLKAAKGNAPKKRDRPASTEPKRQTKKKKDDQISFTSPVSIQITPTLAGTSVPISISTQPIPISTNAPSFSNIPSPMPSQPPISSPSMNLHNPPTPSSSNPISSPAPTPATPEETPGPKKKGRKKKDPNAPPSEKKARPKKIKPLGNLGVFQQNKEEEEPEEEEEEETIFDGDDYSHGNEEFERQKAILDKLSPEQQARYEVYRRASFPRSTMKKLMHSICNQSVNQKMAIVMSGIAKIFVGEIVETARTAMDEWGESGPLKPQHLREAYRRLRSQGKLPQSVSEGNKKLFKHV